MCVEEKVKLVAKFNNDGWMCEFAFIVDVTAHMMELNTCLEGKHQLIISVFHHIKAFKIKLHHLAITTKKQELCTLSHCDEV